MNADRYQWIIIFDAVDAVRGKRRGNRTTTVAALRHMKSMSAWLVYERAQQNQAPAAFELSIAKFERSEAGPSHQQILRANCSWSVMFAPDGSCFTNRPGNLFCVISL